MGATATQIAQVRRLVAEPTMATYDDAAIGAAIEAHPIPDARGVTPWDWDYTTTPPTRETNEHWIESYDLNAAAADLWEEKAAAVACDFAFAADGSSYSRDQVFNQYSRMAQKCRARAVPSALRFTRIQREMTASGAVVETVPIVDPLNTDQVFNR